MSLQALPSDPLVQGIGAALRHAYTDDLCDDHCVHRMQRLVALLKSIDQPKGERREAQAD